MLDEQTIRADERVKVAQEIVQTVESTDFCTKCTQEKYCDFMPFTKDCSKWCNFKKQYGVQE